MVRVNEPVGALVGMVTVSVEEKSGVDDGTLKTPPTPAGSPAIVKETCELKPLRPETLTEYDVVWPWVELWDGGLTSILKSGGCAIVNVTVVVCVIAPAVPVIVITYCPRGMEEVVEMDRIELKLGVPDTGFHDVDMPLGGGLGTVRATFWEVPDTRLTVIE
jgi:hypothetical protein